MKGCMGGWKGPTPVRASYSQGFKQGDKGKFLGCWQSWQDNRLSRVWGVGENASSYFFFYVPDPFCAEKFSRVFKKFSMVFLRCWNFFPWLRWGVLELPRLLNTPWFSTRWQWSWPIERTALGRLWSVFLIGLPYFKRCEIFRRTFLILRDRSKFTGYLGRALREIFLKKSLCPIFFIQEKNSFPTYFSWK